MACMSHLLSNRAFIHCNMNKIIVPFSQDYYAPYEPSNHYFISDIKRDQTAALTLAINLTATVIVLTQEGSFSRPPWQTRRREMLSFTRTACSLQWHSRAGARERPTAMCGQCSTTHSPSMVGLALAGSLSNSHGSTVKCWLSCKLATYRD